MQQPAYAVQGAALAVSTAHTLNRVAGPEGHKLIPRSTLQEAIRAHAARAG